MSKILEQPYGQLVDKAFTLRTAMEEASRCLLCHDAPCSRGCPAGTDPGAFIRSLRLKNIKGAAETIRENNPLAGCCALVCPYDKLCEEACSRTGIDRPIAIGKIQHFLVEQEQALGMKILKAGPPKKKKVLCIGAGPASLSCAAVLAGEGYQVTVAETFAKPGGVLTYGINPTRLPQDVVDFDISRIKELGVRFELGKIVSPQDLPALAKEYDAVFVGVGLWKSKEVDIPGKDLEGVTFALDYLREARSTHAKETASSVLVIGGGDVAMDCASTAKQLGAADTRVVYRRSIAEAPANREELEFVHALGIPIITEFAPKEIMGENGRVTGMSFTGRDGSSGLFLKAEKVIFAIGQEKQDAFDGISPAKGIFSGGDYTNGGKTVVQAVAEGKAAAAAISGYLKE